MEITIPLWLFIAVIALAVVLFIVIAVDIWVNWNEWD